MSRTKIFSKCRESNPTKLFNNASYIPAKYFSMLGLKAMQVRGRMQEGMIADITVFNPDTITETSSMKKGMRGSYTKGIPYVLVNGQVVIDEGVANAKLRAGQPIRYEVIAGGAVNVDDLGDKKFQWHSELSKKKVEALEKSEHSRP